MRINNEVNYIVDDKSDDQLRDLQAFDKAYGNMTNRASMELEEDMEGDRVKLLHTQSSPNTQTAQMSIPRESTHTST
jgi:hypothetical protein